MSAPPGAATARKFTRRARIAVPVVAGVAVAAWLVLAAGGPARPTIPTGVDPPPPVPARFVPGDDAVARGSRFILSLPADRPVDYVIVLDMLRRRFGLDWVAPLVDYARWASARPGGEQARLFARVYDPGARLGSPPSELTRNKTDKLTSTALHCDTYPLPDDYVGDLDRSLSSRILADRTHATIALLWADEHGCLDLADAARLRRHAAGTLEQSVRQETSVDDQWIEAVALLYELGEGTRVEPSWIDAIRAAQRPDGGWAEDATSTGSSGHTTTLALWVLLEAADPDAPRAPWIRDP